MTVVKPARKATSPMVKMLIAIVVVLVLGGAAAGIAIGVSGSSSSTTTAQIQTEVIVSGNVADFTSSVQTAMKDKIASELGVSSSAVSLTIVSASVRVTITVTLDSASAASTAASTLSSRMGSTAAAGTFLSTPARAVTVESIPTPPAVVESTDSDSTAASPPPPPAADAKDDESPPPPATPPPPPSVVAIDWQAIFENGGPQTATAKVGDTITFTWTGEHNVYRSASLTDFNSCAKTGGTMEATTSVSSWSTTAAEAGTLYYICEVRSHCSSSGQKVAITVTTSPSPSPPPPSPSPPPPASSGSTCLTHACWTGSEAPTSTLKILALHGGGGSGSGGEFSPMQDAFPSGVTFVTPNGGYASNDGGYLWVPDPPGGKSQPTTDPAVADASVNALNTIVQQQGPFDGIMGYSQGSMMTLYYLSRVPVGTFRFAVMFCGYVPETHEGMVAYINTAAPITTPAFIFAGSADTTILPAQTEGQRDKFAVASRTYYLGQGVGHDVPANGQPGHSEVVAFINGYKS